jgi:hypothetical protein
VELARQHGVYSVAHPLRLDYTGLKKRLDGVPDSQKKATKPAFVELVAAQPAIAADCVIELESSIGGKMRIHWKSSAALDWISLFRAWRESNDDSYHGADTRGGGDRVGRRDARASTPWPGYARKSSLKTQVGDLFMSLIRTGQLCGANSFDYLIELQRHAQELAAAPRNGCRRTIARLWHEL